MFRVPSWPTRAICAIVLPAASLLAPASPSAASDGPSDPAPGGASPQTALIAQASGDTGSSSEPAGGTLAVGELQEVTVTAQRRAEDMSRVPISMTAMSQAKLDSLGIKDFSDIAKFTPGVVIDSGGSNQISIRGIQSGAGADTTGIYIDDTPIQTRTAVDALPEAFDLERIEVLRGPQGTLFGAGAEGGAVRYITVPPSLTRYSLYSRDEVSYTDGGAPSYEAGVAAGGPLIANVLGIRVGAQFAHDGGWIDRLDSESPALNLVDSNANRSNEKLFRLALLWQPAPGWQITPSFYYQYKNQNDVNFYWPLYSNPGKDQYYDGAPDRNPYEDHFELTSLKIQGNLGFADLISNTSYFNRWDLTTPFGYEGTTANLAYFDLLLGGPQPGGQWSAPGFPLIDGAGIHLPAGLTYQSPSPEYDQYRNWTQEVRLQSANPSSKLLWTVGTFFELDQQTNQNWILGGDDENLFETLTGQSVLDIFGIPELSNPTGDWYTDQDQHTRQYAAYADASYQFTKQWKLDLGVRESWITYDFYSYTAGPQLFAAPQSARGREKQPSFTPKVNLNYQADPNDLYYFTYAKGFRPGGANAAIPASVCAQDFANFGITSTPLSYNSDSTSSYEIGAKNKIGRVAQLATSVYYIRWNGIQQTALLPNCGFLFTDNFGTAVSKGADFQGDFRVTDRLTVNLAAGYTDAHYTQPFKIGPLATINVANSGDAVQGNRPFSGSVGLTYRFDALGHGGFLRVDDQYLSKAAGGAQQDSTTSSYDPLYFRLPSINELNLRTGVTAGPWEIDLFVNNALDSNSLTYYTWTINPGNGTSRLEGANGVRPRTFGLTFIFNR